MLVNFHHCYFADLFLSFSKLVQTLRLHVPDKTCILMVCILHVYIIRRHIFTHTKWSIWYSIRFSFDNNTIVVSVSNQNVIYTENVVFTFEHFSWILYPPFQSITHFNQNSTQVAICHPFKYWGEVGLWCNN